MRGAFLVLSLLVGCVSTLGPDYQPPGAGPGLGGDDDDALNDDDATPDDDDATADDDDSTADDDDAADDDDSAHDDDDAANDDDTADDDDFTPADPGPCPCPFGQLCTGTACVWAPTFAVGVLESETPTYVGSASACLYTTAFLGGPVFVIDGPCQVSVLDPNNLPPRFFSGDAGTVSLTGGNLGPISFSAPPPSECLANPVQPADDLFDPGDSLRFVSSGGVDVPAFDVTVPAPAPIQGAPGLFSRGSDLAVAWNAATSSYVELVLSTADGSNGDAWAVRCHVPDVGGFTVPGALTAWFPGDHTGVTLTLSRNGAEHLEFPAEGVVVEAVAQSSWSVDL